MKSFPEWINTRKDVENLLVTHPEEMKAKLKEWLDNRKVWVITRELAKDDPGISDAVHKVVDMDANDGLGKQKVQMELREDVGKNHLTRVGLSVAEAQTLISQKEPVEKK